MPFTATARREQLAAVREHYRVQAVAYAERVRSLVALGDAYGDDERSLLLDLAGSARMGQVRAAGELERARRLHDLYPRVLVLLDEGRLMVPTVEVLLRLTKQCSERVHQELGRRLPDALVSLDAADAYQLVSRSVLEVEAELEAAEQQERYARARADRRVWVADGEDGMAQVGASVDALTARRVALDLDVLVQAEKARDTRDGITRTQAQRRADVLMELPARYRALVNAVAAGKADELRSRAAAASSASGPVPDELPLGLPPRGRLSCDALDPDELLVDLLRQPISARAVMNVHVPMTSLLGLDEAPALLEGQGYVPAWLARVLLPDTPLRRIAVSSTSGIPLYVDGDLVTWHLRPGGGPDAPPGPGRRRPPSPSDPGPVPPQRTPPDDVDQELARDQARLRSARAAQDAVLSLLTPLKLPDTTEGQHDPSARLRRLVEARDQRCTGPGCRRLARLCHLDHELEHGRGGPTSEPNLSAKSARCHQAKHSGWTVVRDRETGISTWTSPDGETYTRQPAWVRHRTHPAVARLGLTVTELPAVESFADRDLPLWQPPRNEVRPVVTRKPRSWSDDWDPTDPPF
jgi:hypothetical protein